VTRPALALVALGLCWPLSADAKVERFGIIIGNNAGAADEPSLRYAEDDAAKIHEVLGNLGGFRPENLALLRGKDVATVRRALIAFNDRIRSSVQTGRVQVLLFVYYSGHADAEALHLGSSSFDLGELEALVRGSPATVRLMVLDACRSGVVTRVKGGKPGAVFRIRLDERLAGEGVVFLTSSSANEDAHESDAIQGSFFTHYLVSGLLGAADSNGDGTVVLDEAYSYAYANTLRASSRALGGMQHPTYHYDLRGRGDVVLTTVASASRGVLTFPEGRTYLVMKGGAHGPIVAEIGLRDRSRRISLKPGRYFVRGQARRHLLEGTVEAAAGGTLQVADGRLARIEYARLARKGSGPVRMVQGAQAGYRVRTPIASGSSACHGPFLGYALETHHLNLIPRLGFCQGGFTNEDLDATVREIDGELRVTRAWDVPMVTVDVGASVGFALLRQSFAAEVAAPARTTAAGELGVGVGALADLPHGFYATADLAGVTYFLRMEAPFPDRGANLDAVFTVRASGAVGKRW